MNLLLTIFACFSITLSVYASDLTSPFRVDDLEEGPSNIVCVAVASNPSLLSNISISGIGHNRLLSLNSHPNQYGESLITITATDSGLSAERSPESRLTAINGRVNLSWEGSPNKVPGRFYAVNRSSVSIEDSRFLYEAIGFTAGTNFVDTNVINGTSYYYLVTWVPTWATNGPLTPASTNYAFTWKVVPEIPLSFTGDGFAFSAKAGKTYSIMTKTNLNNEVSWHKIRDITASVNGPLLFRGQEYLNKPISVREL